MGPSAFARRLPRVVGTEAARRLVAEAFQSIEATGKPDGWIREVQRARDAGSVHPSVARFVIFKFAESAITALRNTHPRLAAIAVRLEQIEREHGLEEGEYWFLDEGPTEWQALNQEWDRAMDEIMAEIFRRHDELQLALNPDAEGDETFREGAALLFPPVPEEPSVAE